MLFRDLIGLIGNLLFAGHALVHHGHVGPRLPASSPGEHVADLIAHSIKATRSRRPATRYRSVDASGCKLHLSFDTFVLPECRQDAGSCRHGAAGCYVVSMV